MYDIRNICAARTRIGHRALRERRPPPRGTRGTVTAVACPHLSLSFPSTAGATPPGAHLLGYAPFGAARSRALRACGPALFMADARRGPPVLVRGISLRQASSRVRGRMDGRDKPGHDERGAWCINMGTSAGSPRLPVRVRRRGGGEGEQRRVLGDAIRPAHPVMPGLVPGISCGQLRRKADTRNQSGPGHDVSGARRDIIGLSQTARRRRAGRHIFRAGFAGIKWD